MWEMFLEAVCGKRTPAAIRLPRVRSRRPLKPRAGKCAVQAQREKSRIRWFARFSLVHESTLQSWWWSTREIFLKEEGAEKLGWKASKNKPRRPLPFPGTISIKLTLCLQCAIRCSGVPWWLQIGLVSFTQQTVEKYHPDLTILRFDTIYLHWRAGISLLIGGIKTPLGRGPKLPPWLKWAPQCPPCHLNCHQPDFFYFCHLNCHQPAIRSSLNCLIATNDKLFFG